MSAAVIYHSGSFDYVVSPIPGSPTDGARLQDVSRLEAPWGIRTAFATLGRKSAGKRNLAISLQKDRPA